MNPSFLRFSSPVSRLLVAALACLAVGNACSGDSTAPATPTTFGVQVSLLDGKPIDEPVALRCDHGGAHAADTADAFSTLAVSVSLTPLESSRNFVLRPANACGTSTRCGFVRLEALDATGGVLAVTDTVTTEGVLALGLEQLPELTQVRASLVRGVDQQPLQNPDKTVVEAIVSPTFVVPRDCAALPIAGAGGEAASAGAGGEATQPVGGAGGQDSTALAGANGDGTPTAGIGGGA
jgi:hypothetical protein